MGYGFFTTEDTENTEFLNRRGERSVVSKAGLCLGVKRVFTTRGVTTEDTENMEEIIKLENIFTKRSV
jgi:hypothetical protein